MSAEQDPLTPAQRIYTMAVVAAEKKYRQALSAAREIRDREITEALDTCQRVMRMEADHD